jgi:hypothetical protein
VVVIDRNATVVNDLDHILDLGLVTIGKVMRVRSTLCKRVTIGIYACLGVLSQRVGVTKGLLGFLLVSLAIPIGNLAVTALLVLDSPSRQSV